MVKITKEEFDRLKPKCHCPCNQLIPWKEHYKRTGIPIYILGHVNTGKKIKRRHKIIPIEYVLCECNCGIQILKYDKRGRERHYCIGHGLKGKPVSEHTKHKISHTVIELWKDIEYRKKIADSIECRNILSENSGIKRVGITKEEFNILKPRCGCPCNQLIPWKERYRWMPIPKKIRYHKHIKTLTKEEFDATGPHYCSCPDKEIIGWKDSFKRHGISKYIEGHVNKGKKFTKEHCINMGNSISKALKGKYVGTNNKNYGKRRSPEVVEKTRQANLGKKRGPYSEEHKKKISDKRIGFKFSEESIKKMSESHKKIPLTIGCGYGKRGYYESSLQGTVCFRSSYELSYAIYLDKNKILWKYEPSRFNLSNGTSYTPDFYLVNEDKYIEIKGYMRVEAKIKIDLFQKEYPDIQFEVLTKDKLLEMKILVK